MPSARTRRLNRCFFPHWVVLLMQTTGFFILPLRSASLWFGSWRPRGRRRGRPPSRRGSSSTTTSMEPGKIDSTVILKSEILGANYTYLVQRRSDPAGHALLIGQRSSCGTGPEIITSTISGEGANRQILRRPICEGSPVIVRCPQSRSTDLHQHVLIPTTSTPSGRFSGGHVMSSFTRSVERLVSTTPGSRQSAAGAGENRHIRRNGAILVRRNRSPPAPLS